MQTTSPSPTNVPTNAEARAALLALLRSAQQSSRAWWALCWILLIEQALDVTTTALALPLGAHELNPLGAWLYVQRGVVGIAIPKLVYALILLGLTLYFVAFPAARRGRWTTLGFISSIIASLIYGVAMYSNLATLMRALLISHHLI